jgi:hypothetical protein
MRVIRSIAVVAALAACSCTTSERGTLRPRLAFRIPGDSTFRAARDITVDRAGDLFIFDYGSYLIRRYDSAGTLVATFGGSGTEPGRFGHLMAIRADGDSLLALDAGSISVFDLSGNLRSRRPLADTVTCDLPRLRPDGRWAAACIVQATAEQTLSYRRADGTEERRPASYSLGEVFPGVQAGQDFFVNPTQARDYLYDFTPDGRLVWVASDRLRVLVDRAGVDEALFEAEAAALPFPADSIAALRERQARVPPPFFINVPDRYQLIHHLLVAESGDVWLYVTSQERRGLLRLSAAGRETGFYALAAEFDPLSARLTAANGRLYFMVPGREETAVYSVALP